MSKLWHKTNQIERGAVSLFIVIFSALLLTVLTIGFIRIMIKEQQQATNDDLSQSAYDSAVAGVEDGKRAIRKCLDGGATDPACTAISLGKCDTIVNAGVVPSLTAGETVIKSSGGSESTSLNQAYTCVKVDMNTDDFYTGVAKDQSKMIPLRAAKLFSSIRIHWMHKGLLGQSEAGTLESPTAAGLGFDALPQEKDWNASAASLIRAQAILPTVAPGGSIIQSDLDTSMVSTMFLRPAGVSAAAGSINPSMTIGLGRAANSDAGASNSPRPVQCSKDEYAAGGLESGYACNATLSLNGGAVVPAESALAYLRLTSLYRDTSVRIELLDASGTIVQFMGVQPRIDSTGRASNVFRRVVSRINLATDSPAYPEFAVDVTGSLCKDFYVTADKDGASSGATCSTAPQ